MKKGFIATLNSVVEFRDIVKMFEQKGVDAENVVINTSFEEFSQSLSSGDIVVIRSYADVFASLSYFFTKYIELSHRGIAIESIQEPSIDISPANVKLVKLLSDVGTSIRTNSTQKGLMKAKSEGKKLGRPFGSTKLDGKIREVDKLRKDAKMSVAKACKIVGCEPRTYYRYYEKQRGEETLEQS